MVEEHERIINVLQHPTKQKLEEEAKEQSDELRKYLNKAMSYDLKKKIA